MKIPKHIIFNILDYLEEIDELYLVFYFFPFDVMKEYGYYHHRSIEKLQDFLNSWDIVDTDESEEDDCHSRHYFPLITLFPKGLDYILARLEPWSITKEILETFISNGLDLNYLHPERPYPGDANGNPTLLFQAAEWRMDHIIEYCLELGADPYVKDPIINFNLLETIIAGHGYGSEYDTESIESCVKHLEKYADINKFTIKYWIINLPDYYNDLIKHYEKKSPYLKELVVRLVVDIKID